MESNTPSWRASGPGRPCVPHDGAGLGVHRRLGEELDLAERLEYRTERASQLRLEVDGPDGTVGEADLSR